MKTAIHYFTGTGNTAHSVKLISEQLKAAGHEVEIRQVKRGVVPPDGFFDFHIVAFPVLSWAPPVIIKRYLRKFPVSKGTKTAILAINGSIFHNGKLIKGYTGQALEQAECILRRRKYDVFLTANASFPDNWTQATNPCSKEDAAVIVPLGEAEVKQFTEDFINEKRELYRCGLVNKSWSYLVAELFGIVGRRAMGKFYIADNNCTGCGICAKQCPVKTIRMDNHKPKSRPYWGISCEDCNRCINICPEKAIQVSVPFLILLLGINISLTLFANRAIAICTALMIHVDKTPQVGIEILLKIVSTLLLLWVTFVPIAALLHKLLRIPGVRKFFSLSYTKNFRRYHHI